MSKLMTLPEAEIWAEEMHNKNKKIVFTNGCFDIVHAGHIKSFKEAKSFGDYLVVGLNSDASISKIKGPNRPIVDQENRILLLESIEYIDLIVLFEDPTADKLILSIKPDVYVKGSDCKYKDFSEKKIVESYDGKVCFIDLVDKLSTTNIISKILKIYGNNT